MTLKSSSLSAVGDILAKGNSFLIAGHVNPDGDCLGCMCGLGLALSGIGKQVTLLSPDGVPYIYSFLPFSDKVVTEVPEGSRFDVGVAVDCEDLSRAGAAEPLLRASGVLVEIDHHPGGGEKRAPAQLVDPSASAVGEIVYDLLNSMGIRMDARIAECLLAAIVTDTGSFRFTNVTPTTLRIAADLLERGGSLQKIAHNVYESRSFASTKLLGMALSTLKVTANGHIAWASISREQMAASEATEAETEGIVNYVRSVRGAQVGLLFREAPDRTTRVSLRARNGVDVSQIARLFGGGGHKTAAGCSLDRPLSEAETLVVDAVCKWMGY